MPALQLELGQLQQAQQREAGRVKALEAQARDLQAAAEHAAKVR
jgi:hypothetical protein